MLTTGWRLGRIGGVEIRADPSLLLIAGLITFNLWVTFSGRFPHLSTSASVALAALTAVLFFASILVHELAHAGMSTARQIPVLGITLWMFGGATHAKVEARGPGDEFLVTVVGPLSSAALGGLFLVVHASGEALGGPAVFLFGYLGAINLLLAVFNLLPGFPLDGGRLLRSIVWKVTGSLHRATRIAARVGQGVALLIAAAGLYQAIARGNLVLALWPALIGWFLFRAATDSLAEDGRRLRLQGTRAGQLMSSPPPAVPPDLPVGTALAGLLYGHEGEAFPVVEDGSVLGFVSEASARGVEAHRLIRDAVFGSRAAVSAGPEETMDVVVERMGEPPSRTVLVFEGGALVGVIEPEDLGRYLKRLPRAPVR